LAAQELLTEVNNKVLQKTRLVFQPVYVLGNVVADTPDVARRPTGFSHPLLGYLLEALRSAPQIYSLYMGYDDGDFYQVISFLGVYGLTRSALSAPPDAQRAVRQIYQDRNGKRIEV